MASATFPRGLLPATCLLASLYSGLVASCGHASRPVPNDTGNAHADTDEDSDTGSDTGTNTGSDTNEDSGGEIDIFSLAEAWVIELVGEVEFDAAGSFVSDAGDVNADGFADILVGAPWKNDESPTAGRAYLLYGPITAGRDLSLADVKLSGEADQSYAGTVSAAGDVNADGFADILVGAPAFSGRDCCTGAVYVLLGPVTADRNLSLADARIEGEEGGDFAGSAISEAGDVNADGFADIVIGVYSHDEAGIDAGAAYLVYGPASGDSDLSCADAEFAGEFQGDYAGRSVSGAGDVNADGYADILIGAPGNPVAGGYPGAAYVIYGPVTAGRRLSLADAKLVGEYPGWTAGKTVSNAGDVNADGFADILVAAPGLEDYFHRGGFAYLIYGPVTGERSLALADATFLGEKTDTIVGIASDAGDVNADGFADILVASEYAEGGREGAGAAYLFDGPITGEHGLSLADASFVGENPGDGAGSSIAGAGDVDADDLSDILIGAPWVGDGGFDAGAAYLVLSARVP
jgi:hypothetical protein